MSHYYCGCTDTTTTTTTATTTTTTTRLDVNPMDHLNYLGFSMLDNWLTCKL